MSTADERLLVALELKTRDFERAQARINGVNDRRMRQLEQRTAQASKRMEASFRSSTANINRLLGGLGVGISLNELRNLAEVWSDLTSRVNIAAGSQEQGAAVMARLSEMARRTYSDISQTTNAFVSNSQALKDLGYSTSTQLDYVEALNNALVVSGAKGQTAESVMNALSKAMALGELRGDSLNTVISTGGRVAQALADGLGVTVNELRALGTQGKLTSDKVVKALTGELGKLREEAESMPATISDAIVLLKNSLTQYVGQLNEANGVTAIFSDAIILAADNVESIAAAAAMAGLVLTGKYVPALARATAAQAAMITTNPFLLLVTAIGAATFALHAFGDQITPIEGDLANLQDYAGAAWTTIKEGAVSAGQGINDALVTAINFISEAVSGAEVSFADLGDFVKTIANQIIGELKLVYDTVRIAFTKLPAAIAESVINAMNSMIAGIERGLNGVVRAVNSTISALNSVGEHVGITMTTMKPVVLNRIKNAYEGAGTEAGEAFADAMRDAAQDHVGNVLGSWREKANQRAADRIANQPEAPEIDSEDRPVTRPSSGAGGSGRGGRGGGGRGGKGSENEFDRQVKAINDRIAALRMETETRRGLTGSLEEQEAALERARLKHELLTAAQNAGLAITPELQARIDALADSYMNASQEAQALAKSQEEAARKAEEWKAMSQDLVKGFVADLRQGKAPLDAILDGLNRIADKLLDMALNSLFENAFGGAGGGLFGFLGKALGLKDGGEVKAFANGGHVRGPGTGTSDSIPAMLSNGEFVVNAKATARNRAVLEGINAGSIAGFSSGGLVGRASRSPSTGAGQNITIAPSVTVNANGGTPAQNAELAAQTAKAVERSVRAIVGEEILKQSRPGNYLNRR